MENKKYIIGIVAKKKNMLIDSDCLETVELTDEEFEKEREKQMIEVRNYFDIDSSRFL